MVEHPWWEEFEGHRVRWCVMRAEQLDPEPVALFPEREDAERWRDELNARIKTEGGYADAFVTPVRAVSGEFWNSIDDPPA